MTLRLRRHNTSTVTDPTPRVEETGQNQFVPEECEADIVIGIDFGTTFSGIAYALTANLPKKPEDKSKLVNHVNIIRGWPGNVMADKVPSLLYYRTSDSTPSWGFTAQKNADKYKDGFRIAHFKLGLQRDLSVYAPIPSDSPLGGGYATNYDWHHPNLGSKKAINFATDYLSCIFNYSKERLESHHGAARLENQKTAYVVTVPAIWGGEAKELTRRVATNAGIPRRSLILITEPEAAAVYCSSKCKQEGGLKVNDKFLICDAGGGTVDLISYQVLTLDPFKIHQSSPATGAACASVHLDINFEKLIRTKLGRFADSILVKSVPTDLQKFFDTLKRDFDPYSPECDEEFEIPLKNAPERPEIFLSEGSLTIQKKDLVKHVFLPIFEKTLKLIDEQIRVVGVTNMKKVFLVGGLGSNIYLGKYLKDKLKRKSLEVLQPPDGVTAIMSGAVLYKLGLDLVKSRPMEVSYGVAFNQDFKPGHHPVSKKIVCIDGVTRCENVMNWYVRKGDQIENGHKTFHPFFRNISAAKYREPVITHSIMLYVCDNVNPPEYLDPPETYHGPPIKEECPLELDLRTLPPDAMTRQPQGGDEYWRVDYDLGLHFGPGGIEFRLVYDGEVRSVATCQYPTSS